MIIRIENFLSKEDYDICWEEISKPGVFPKRKPTERRNDRIYRKDGPLLEIIRKNFKLHDNMRVNIHTTMFNKTSLINFHNDVGEGSEKLRYNKSWIFQFNIYFRKNSPFEGGNFELDRGDGKIESIEPKDNECVMFVSGMSHSISPITEGDRYTLGGFVLYDNDCLFSEYETQEGDNE